jgi:hypothetical protein
MMELKKRVVRIAVPLLGAWLCLLPPPAAGAKEAVIRNLRIGSTPEYVRLVLESDRPLNPSPSLSLKHRTLIVTLAAIIDSQAVDPSEPHSRGIADLQFANGPHAVARIQVDFSFTPRDVRTFTLTGPHRFIIDAYRPPASLPSESAAAEKNQLSRKADGRIQRATRAGNRPASIGTDRAASGTTEAAVPPTASAGTDRGSSGREAIPQSLLAALIGVTSTIIVLLFFRICFGNSRTKTPGTSRSDLLPPGEDPEIKHLDAQIAEKINALFTTEKDQAADRRLACMTEIIQLSHQKSERLNQRLTAVITTLEKGRETDGGI